MAPPTWNRYSPDPTPDGEPTRPTHSTPGARKPSARNPAARKPAAAKPRRFHPAGLAITVGVVALALGLPVLFAVLGNEGGSDGKTPQGRAGFGEMLDALREETGSTTVFEAVIYPEYAVVDVPYKPGDEREVSYRWDGDDLDEWTKGTSDYVPFDLADVNEEVLDGLCPQTADLVEDAGVCYLIVRHPRADSDEKAWLWAYTSNDFSQGGYISFDLEGNEVGRTTW